MFFFQPYKTLYALLFEPVRAENGQNSISFFNIYFSPLALHFSRKRTNRGKTLERSRAFAQKSGGKRTRPIYINNNILLSIYIDISAPSGRIRPNARERSSVRAFRFLYTVGRGAQGCLHLLTSARRRQADSCRRIREGKGFLVKLC